MHDLDRTSYETNGKFLEDEMYDEEMYDGEFDDEMYDEEMYDEEFDDEMYDDMGRVYRKELVTVDDSTGADGDVLRTQGHYDRNSQLVAVSMKGRGGVELAYDGVGRRYQKRRVRALEDTQYSTSNGSFNYRAPLPVPGINA